MNTSSLTVVSQPASGTATVATTASSGIITYTPATATAGVQTLTFAYCAPGDTYPSAGNCTTATMTYRPSTGQWLGDQVEGQNIVEQIENAVTLPATVVHGSTLSMTVAPVASNVPSSDSGDGITVTVYNASQFSEIIPVPKGLTYVPGSVNVTGGDATTSGNVAATYCTAPVSDACSAHIDSGDYKTTYPYLQTYLNPNTTVTGGDNVTMPTLSAEFTATGTAGTVVPADLTEYVLNTDVSYVGEVTFDGYPSCSSCGSGSNAPTYAAPVPQATTTITPAPTVTGVDPNTGTPAGGTSVVISGSDLADASAVDFGSLPATITADSATSVTATSPPGTGTVDITVTTPDGTSATSSADQFTYGLSAPPPTLTSVSPTGGPTAGGTSVTVAGDNLGSATAVDFGPGNPGTITADSATSVTATSPSGTGTVDVTVTTPSGTTVPSQPDQFTYGTPVLTKLSSWTDTAACGVQSTTSAPTLTSSATLTAIGAVGGGGGGALYSTSGGPGGAASSVSGTVPVTGGQQLSAVTGCAGATAPDDTDVPATGGAGGAGFSNGGGGGNGYYCIGANVEGECLGEGGADGSAGGGGGSSALCSGSSCQAGGTPLAVAGGGGGGGESTLPDSDGGTGGVGGSGSSTASTDQTGAGPSGAVGGTGATDVNTGNTGGAGGVNSSGDSAGGGVGGNGLDTVSAGESAANGGGGGGYVGGAGSTDDTAEDGGAGGGGGGGSSWILNGSGATFATTSAPAAVTVAFYGFVGTGPSVGTQPTATTVDAGQSATFTAAASGNPTPAVQWQVSTDGGKTFNDVLGATSTTYTLTAEPSESGNQYQAVFTNSVGAVTTDAVMLTVDSAPTVTTQPAAETVNQGQPATFTAAASGTSHADRPVGGLHRRWDDVHRHFGGHVDHVHPHHRGRGERQPVPGGLLERGRHRQFRSGHPDPPDPAGHHHPAEECLGARAPDRALHGRGQQLPGTQRAVAGVDQRRHLLHRHQGGHRHHLLVHRFGDREPPSVPGGVHQLGRLDRPCRGHPHGHGRGAGEGHHHIAACGNRQDRLLGHPEGDRRGFALQVVPFVGQAPSRAHLELRWSHLRQGHGGREPDVRGQGGGHEDVGDTADLGHQVALDHHQHLSGGAPRRGTISLRSEHRPQGDGRWGMW